MTEEEIFEQEEMDYLLADFLIEEGGNPEGWCSIHEGTVFCGARRFFCGWVRQY